MHTDLHRMDKRFGIYKHSKPGLGDKTRWSEGFSCSSLSIVNPGRFGYFVPGNIHQKPLCWANLGRKGFGLTIQNPGKLGMARGKPVHIFGQLQ